MLLFSGLPELTYINVKDVFNNYPKKKKNLEGFCWQGWQRPYTFFPIRLISNNYLYIICGGKRENLNDENSFNTLWLK